MEAEMHQIGDTDYMLLFMATFLITSPPTEIVSFLNCQTLSEVTKKYEQKLGLIFFHKVGVTVSFL